MASLVEIGRVYGASELGLIKSAFDAAEITLFDFDGHAGQVATQYTLALGGIRLCVLDADQDAAVALLNDFRAIHRNRPHWIACLIMVLGFFLSGASVPATGVFPRSTRDVDMSEMLSPNGVG